MIQIANHEYSKESKKIPINIVVRLKNPWFWIGIIGVFFNALHVTPENASSWKDLLSLFISFIQNPYVICNTIVAMLGVIVDPTTNGIEDSEMALTYKEPKK